MPDQTPEEIAEWVETLVRFMYETEEDTRTIVARLEAEGYSPSAEIRAAVAEDVRRDHDVAALLTARLHGRKS